MVPAKIESSWQFQAACCLYRHGQALDLQDDYMASMRDDNKENAHQQSSSSKDNWPEVEIRVASKPSGEAVHVAGQSVLQEPDTIAANLPMHALSHQHVTELVCCCPPLQRCLMRRSVLLLCSCSVP